jgi:L-malate glycosyltransferase
MRILHAVELYSPSVGGAQEVVRQVSVRLAERGHDVTVATRALADRASPQIDGVAIEEFDAGGSALHGLSGEVERYRDFVRDGGFDAVMTYAAQQWTTDALLDMVGDVPAATVLAPCGFSGLGTRSWRPYFRRLSGAMREFDALVFHSETYQDIEFARAAGLANLHVIPNGADEREFGGDDDGVDFRELHGIGAAEPLLLTVGGHTGLKGHARVLSALRALDTPATLALVGNTPVGGGCLAECERLAERGGRRVLMLDPPREEVVAAYRAADLFVFASEVEASPLVLYEANAAGMPFVSGPAGNAEEIARWTGGGVVVPAPRRRRRVRVSPRRLARAADELLADSSRRAELGERGRRAWRESFTWDAVASRYERLYEELAS